MKKTIYFIIITLITIGCIIGGMLHFTGGLTGFRISTIKTKPVFQDDGEVTSIILDSAVMDAEFHTGDKLQIAYGGNEKLKPEISLKDGVLTITQRDKVKNKFNFFGLGKNGAKLDVVIPSGTKLEKFTSQIDVCDMDLAQLEITEADIHGNVGDINVFGAKIDRTEITLNTGDLEVNDSELGSGTITVNTGDTDVKRCTFSELDVNSDMGDIDIELTGERNTYALDLSNDIGDIEVFGNDEGKSYAQQGSGSGGSALTVKGHIGDIEVK